MFEEAKWDLWIVRFEGRVSSCDYSPSQVKGDQSWSKSNPVLIKIIKQGISIIMITTSKENCDKKFWETVVYPRGFLQKTISRLVCWAAGLPPHSLAMSPAVISASAKISCFGIELEFLRFPSPSFQQNSKHKPALLIAIGSSIDCLPKTMFRKWKIEAFHWFKINVLF